MATIPTLKSNHDSAIRQKTIPGSLTTDNEADQLDGLADEIRDRGVLQTALATDLNDVSSTDYKNVIVANDGIYQWEESGTADNDTIFDAADTGVFVKKFSGSAGIEDVTYAELVALITNSELNAGTSYKITDKGDLGIIVQSISANQLSKDGTRIMLCPKSYLVGALDGNAWKGVWHSTKTAAVNELMIFGGKVWKNLTGAIGTSSDLLQTLDGTNWVLIPKATFTNSEYIPLVFSVRYNFASDWIYWQADNYGNEFGVDKSFWVYLMQFGSFDDFPGAAINPVDISDWNYPQDGSAVSEYSYMTNNKVVGIWNNWLLGPIKDNYGGAIFKNRGLVANDYYFGILGNDIKGIDGEYIGVISNNASAWISRNICVSITGNAAEIADNVINSIGSNTANDINNNIGTNDINNNNMGTGSINNNANNANISNNTATTGSILNNRNNGTINGNALSIYNIHFNINNGTINNKTLVAHITDTVVNK